MKRLKGDVTWHLPGKKKPIAYSTKADSDLIVTLGELYGTVQETFNNINYSNECKDILRKYIEAGYGETMICELFH